MSDTAPENDNTEPKPDKPQEVIEFPTIEIVDDEPPAGPELKLVIDIEDALRGLREARDEKGADYIYQKPDPNHQSCVYCWPIDGQLQPQCIAGYALAKLGVPVELMYELANDLSVYALAEALAPRGYRVTRPAMWVLRAAQCVQDAAVGMGGTSASVYRPADDQVNWGAAVVAAEREAERQAHAAAREAERQNEESPPAPAPEDK